MGVGIFVKKTAEKNHLMLLQFQSWLPFQNHCHQILANWQRCPNEQSPW